MQKILTVIAVSLTGLLLAGCPKKPTTVQTPAGGEAVGGVAGNAGTTSGENAGDVGAAQPLPGADANAANASAATTILFDFDSSEVRPEYNAAITTHARRLAAGGGLRVRLEGNTDERGSPEYNVGLGERRAQAVKRALVLQGAPEASIATVSYGEERPTVEGESEEAWAQNRRVEIVFLGAGR